MQHADPTLNVLVRGETYHGPWSALSSTGEVLVAASGFTFPTDIEVTSDTLDGTAGILLFHTVALCSDAEGKDGHKGKDGKAQEGHVDKTEPVKEMKRYSQSFGDLDSSDDEVFFPEEGLQSGS